MKKYTLKNGIQSLTIGGGLGIILITETSSDFEEINEWGKVEAKSAWSIRKMIKEWGYKSSVKFVDLTPLKPNPSNNFVCVGGDSLTHHFVSKDQRTNKRYMDALFFATGLF